MSAASGLKSSRAWSALLMHKLHGLRFLEEELARKYKEAAPATLAVLQLRCEQAAADLAEAARQLEAAQDVAALRQAGEPMHALRLQTPWLLPGLECACRAQGLGCTSRADRAWCVEEALVAACGHSLHQIA